MDVGNSTPASTAAVQPKGGGRRWTLTAAILASSMVFIDGTALNVALPALQADLGVEGAVLFWIVNAYLLMLAVLMLVGGALGDRFGRKRVFMAGITLFMLASLACGLAPSGSALVIFRGVQGMGGALMIPGSLAIIAAGFPAGDRGRAYGIWAAATTTVTVGGPVLGGVLADAGLWRAVFLLNLPLAVAALLILGGKVGESRDEEAPEGLDYPGAIMAALGLGLMTFGFLRAPDAGFGDPSVIAALAAGGILLPLFILNEYRSPHPMLPLRLFRSRTFTCVNLLTFLLYGGLSVSMFFLTLNMIQVQGYSAAFAGFALTPFAILMAAASAMAGRLADRVGARPPLVAGPAVAGLSMLMMGMVGFARGSGEYWTSFLPMVLMLGLGMGLTVAPLTSALMDSVATHQAGVASGVNNSISRLAGVMSIAILGSAFLFHFQGSVEQRVANLDLSPQQRQQVLEQASRVGEAEAPASLEPSLAAAVNEVYDRAYISGFDLLMYVSAALAFSAGLSALLLEGRRR